MKSIKEKAKEFGILNSNIHYDADGNTYNDIDKPSTDFEDGANYVLDAIVSIINQPMNDYLVLEELWNTIEELRK